MGLITGFSQNDFISADYVYSKIKREFKSFDAVNILDDTDFPTYTADVLADLGIGALSEDEALIKVENGKATLPPGFKGLHAAYKCKSCTATLGPQRQLQNTSYFEHEVKRSIRRSDGCCDIQCATSGKTVECITINTYVNEDCNVYRYDHVGLLKLSPNVRQLCDNDCPNMYASGADEITINNGCLFTNFSDGDIFLQYYSMPLDGDNVPLLPNKPEVLKAVEWYIKWQILLNYWLVDDLANAQNKWSKAEQEYEKAMGKARFLDKLPAFATLVNSLRNRRAINKANAFTSRY